MSGNYLVRPAEPADLEALIALRLEALRDSPTAFGADYAQSLEQSQSFWRSRFLVDENEGQVVMAVAGGELIGVTGISRRMSPKALHSATIWGVYVRPAWRGQRVTDALFAACFAWARHHAVVIVKLGVVTENLPAIRAYQRLGFSIFGTEPEALYVDGKYYAEYLMCKNVS